MHIIDGKMPKFNKCCFVYGCFSTSFQSRNISFHKFPPKGEHKFIRIAKYGIKQVVNRRQVWMEALNIGRGIYHAIDKIRVCSLHFAKGDYYQPDGSNLWYLKKTAVPRRNLPTSWSSPLATRFIVRSLNRLKYRGYFGIHNPDGRKVTVRRRYLGEKYNKQKSNSSSYKKTVWIPRKPLLTGNIDNDSDEDSENSNNQFNHEIINPHTLSETNEFNDDNKQSPNREDKENGDKEVTVDDTVEGNAEAPPEAPWSPSQVIIKEELISDHEDEFGPEDRLRNKDGEEFKEVEESHNEPINDDEEEEEENDTPQDEEMPFQLDEDNYEEENYSVEEICKVCGEENCQGHPGTRPKENFFVCLVCSEIFTSQKQLAIHSKLHDKVSSEQILATEHKYNDLTCKFCGRTLATRATLKEHIMIHTGEKPYKCVLCGKSFRHKANLVVHVNAHTVVNSFNCPQCSETFSRRTDLEKHIKSHIYSDFVCKICNSKFKSQRTLYNHSLLHSKKGEVRKKRQSGRKSKGAKIHVCKQCGKVLSTSATLKEHMLIHSGEKPHVCLLCGKTVRHKANFVVHVQSHSQGKSYECNICEDAFVKKSDLRQHKILMHSEIKVYTCPICAGSFKSIAKFNEHAETHSQEEIDEVNQQEESYDYELLQPHLLEAFLTES